MKVIGFNLLKGEIRYSLLEGTKSDPVLLEKDRHLVISAPLPLLMDWFDSTFTNIIYKTKPERIAYRLSLEPSRAQISYLIFPYGILNLIAHNHKIPIFEYTIQNFVPSKLGLNKGDDLYAYCTQVFGKQPPYWDNNLMHAILAAWLSME